MLDRDTFNALLALQREEAESLADAGGALAEMMTAASARHRTNADFARLTASIATALYCLTGILNARSGALILVGMEATDPVSLAAQSAHASAVQRYEAAEALLVHLREETPADYPPRALSAAAWEHFTDARDLTLAISDARRFWGTLRAVQ
jgi:hypothetical protein